MAIKKYHVSKNLLEDVITGANIAANGSIAVTPDYNIWVAKVTAGETYRANNVNGTYGFYTEKPTISSITYNNSRELFSGDSPTIVVPQGISYIGIRATVAATNVMLNTGSTAEPYEPYDPEVWHTIPYKRYETSTDTLTTLPAEVIADGNNATVGLKGNMSQSGTPTPQNPIEPSETGERTGNLVENRITTSYGGSIIGSDGVISPSGAYDTWYAKVTAGETYTMSRVNGVYAFYSAEPQNGSASIDGQRYYTDSDGTKTVTIPTGVTYVAMRTLYNGDTPMLNAGSTALPYEPYGQYKIPISSANTTTNVYLGEVQTTRKIKKYECTGQENWDVNPSTNVFFANIDGALGAVGVVTAICSHYNAVENKTLYNQVPNNSMCIRANASILWIKDTNYDSGSYYTAIDDFKAYLAAQYAAGTPVTVWYVLAEPTTGIVNEPLRKIGDYADTVSGITIPTITGKDSFDVQTTLKPSEVELTYTGWHDATVKEWDGSEWD